MVGVYHYTKAVGHISFAVNKKTTFVGDTTKLFNLPKQFRILTYSLRLVVIALQEFFPGLGFGAPRFLGRGMLLETHTYHEPINGFVRPRACRALDPHEIRALVVAVLHRFTIRSKYRAHGVNPIARIVLQIARLILPRHRDFSFLILPGDVAQPFLWCRWRFTSGRKRGNAGRLYFRSFGARFLAYLFGLRPMEAVQKALSFLPRPTFCCPCRLGP